MFQDSSHAHAAQNDPKGNFRKHKPHRHSRKKARAPSGKVLVKLFQKLARSRASSPWRAPQSAKSPDRRFFLIDFSLRLLPAKKNRLWSAESNMRARFSSENFLKEVFRHLSRTFPNDFYSVMGCLSAQDIDITNCRQAPPRPCRHSRKSEIPFRKSFGQAFSKACEVKGE